MPECIFCLIAKKSVKSRIVYEDSDTVAFLDITPRSKGMCLVIPKKHFENFMADLEISKKIFEVSLKIAEKIKEALNPKTIFISIIPSQVPHIHIRVYPVYENQIPLIENNPISISDTEMDDIAKKIIMQTKFKASEEVEKKNDDKPKIRDNYWHKKFEVA